MYFERPFDWTLGFGPLLPEIFPMCFKWNWFKLHKVGAALFFPRKDFHSLAKLLQLPVAAEEEEKQKEVRKNLARGFSKLFKLTHLSQ